MDETKLLAQQFEASRPHLRAVAYRMLGSLSEAEDAVQESWLKLSRAEVGDVANLGGWLTTVVARVCLDHLRRRRSRREEPLEADDRPEPPAGPGADPEHEAAMADSVGLALLVVLQTLAPAERVAFVLHDLFDLTFDEIAPILGRTPATTRQLASRARRRVQGAPRMPDPDLAGRRRVVDAFLAASRGGRFEDLLAVLDPGIVVRPDTAAMRAGAPSEIRGPEAVARFFLGRATGARPALIDGAVGAVVAPQGRLFLALGFTIEGGRITAIEAIMDPERLRRLDLAVL
ncbi:sigma-70 family RNA polymerase sigma factor [Inquilinus limosus]|uniref:RNA polymerase subunit sigma-70 n=1 Tax=Inquilinus limosus TaxID=171674 RepID=A0A211ZPR8_9PROT|nr:sigma-70 family RNA polymerase sigma factor [Inquilinus limosus]OWJ67250.1 RNA polymerase subunit sigma-70 [Inquilinus limosus]